MKAREFEEGEYEQIRLTAIDGVLCVQFDRTYGMIECDWVILPRRPIL